MFVCTCASSMPQTPTNPCRGRFSPLEAPRLRTAKRFSCHVGLHCSRKPGTSSPAQPRCADVLLSVIAWQQTRLQPVLPRSPFLALIGLCRAELDSTASMSLFFFYIQKTSHNTLRKSPQVLLCFTVQQCTVALPS